MFAIAFCLRAKAHAEFAPMARAFFDELTGFALAWQGLFWLFNEYGIDRLQETCGRAHTSLLAELAKADKAHSSVVRHTERYLLGFPEYPVLKRFLKEFSTQVHQVRTAAGGAAMPNPEGRFCLLFFRLITFSAAMPLAATAASSSHIFMFGGASFGRIVQAVYRFTISDSDVKSVDNGWQRVAAVQPERFPHAAVVDGQIYIVGKFTECFNPLDNSVVQLGPSPYRSGTMLGAFGYEHRLFAVNSQEPIQAFDPNTCAWSAALPALPTLPDSFVFLRGAFLVGNEVWIVASQAQGDRHAIAFYCSLANPQLKWQEHFLSNTVSFPVVAALRDGLVLLGDSVGDSNLAYKFDTRSRTLISLPPLSQDVRGGVAVVADDKIYVVSHSEDGTFSNGFAIIEHVSGRVTRLSPLPFATFGVAAVHWTKPCSSPCHTPRARSHESKTTKTTRRCYPSQPTYAGSDFAKRRASDPIEGVNQSHSGSHSISGPQEPRCFRG